MKIASVLLPGDIEQRMFEMCDVPIYHQLYKDLGKMAEQYVPTRGFSGLLFMMFRLYTPQDRIEWMHTKIPEFIYAIIDDPTVAREMVDIHEHTLTMARQGIAMTKEH